MDICVITRDGVQYLRNHQFLQGKTYQRLKPVHYKRGTARMPLLKTLEPGHSVPMHLWHRCCMSFCSVRYIGLGTQPQVQASLMAQPCLSWLSCFGCLPASCLSQVSSMHACRASAHACACQL